MIWAPFSTWSRATIERRCVFADRDKLAGAPSGDVGALAHVHERDFGASVKLGAEASTAEFQDLSRRQTTARAMAECDGRGARSRQP